MQKLKENFVPIALISLAVITLTIAAVAGKPKQAQAPAVKTPVEAKNSPVATSTPETAPKPKPSPKPASVATPAPDKAKLEAFLIRVGGDPAQADEYLTAAQASGIDWRLLPAIAQQESQSGKQYPKSTNNLWGYGCAKGIPCYISSNGSNLEIFTSIADGIDKVSDALANARYYTGKTTYNKLAAYNGNPGYPERIIAIMKSIAN